MTYVDTFEHQNWLYDLNELMNEGKFREAHAAIKAALKDASEECRQLNDTYVKLDVY